MKPRKNYSLVTSGLFLLVFASQFLLLAPYEKTGFFAVLPPLVLDLLGATFFLHGALLVSSILLNAPPALQTKANLTAALLLALIAWAYFQFDLFIEEFVLSALSLAFVLCNWLKPNRVWLVLIMQWVNIVIGVGLLWQPAFLLTAPAYLFLSRFSIFFGALFILSGLISLAIGVFPTFQQGKAGRFLALPWLLWTLPFIPSFELPHIGIALGVGSALAINEYVPWKRVIMRQATDIGKRFLYLTAISQMTLLALMTVMIRYLETNLDIPPSDSHSIRQMMIFSFDFLGALGVLTVIWVNLSINGAFSGLAGSTSETQPMQKPAGFWKRLANSLLEPFETSQGYISEIVDARQNYEILLTRQLATEKRRIAQLNLLHSLNRSLELTLDPPVAAQLTVNAIQNALGGVITAVLRFDEAREEMVLLAASGPNASVIPSGYRQAITIGLIGRAARLRKTQIASDTHLDPNYLPLENSGACSELIVPLLQSNRLRGIILVDHQETNYFDDSDIRTLETVAIQLVTAWMRSEHDQRLTSLINAGVTLSTTMDVEEVIKQIVHVAQDTLDAQFVFIALVDRDGSKFTRTAHAGHAPALLAALKKAPDGNSLVQATLNSTIAVRLRDVHKKYNSTPIDSSDLNSLLAIPIRLRQSSVGVILAFGKKRNNLFTESDEGLLSLLAAQSAAAIEAAWLYQEVRSMLATATQLYQLSTRVLLSEQQSDAASAIAETAYRLSKGTAAGIVLLSPEKEVDVNIQTDSSGLHPGSQHFMALIYNTIESGKMHSTAGQNGSDRLYWPLQTPRRQYGAVWVETEESQDTHSRLSDTMHSLTNQAAIALERNILLAETRKQTEQIEIAYRELETTYDHPLGALSLALDARDSETEGHSLRVARLALELGKRMGFTPEQAKVMERGAILHDIGKIGISDSILLKPGPLTPGEWEVMRLHPDIGARIIEAVPFLKDALPVIRYHQERWDGTGYPIGLKGQDIPLMARIFAVVDAFDALTSDRPYRKPIPIAEAVAYLREKVNILFDQNVVEKFAEIVEDGTLETIL